MIGDNSSLTALYLTNPAAAQAMRRQQFGAQLASGALGGEPIQAPSQGVAKLAQALVGALLMNKADSQFEEMGKQQAAERERFGSLLSSALTGAPPPVREPAAPAAPMPAAAGGGFPPDLMPHVQEASQRTGIPAPLLMAVIRQESGGNPQAVGDGGQSIGPMQVQRRTAAQPGYGVTPIDPVTLSDPRTNINFGADYLAARARTAGVQDWNDPAQRAKALRAYNGGGDPNYVANVERYLPQGGVTMAPAGAQPPIPRNVEADLDLAKRQQAIAIQMANSQDPMIRHQSDMLFRAAQAAEARAVAMQNRADTLANRPMQTVTLAGPNGTAMVHEMTPQGPGRVIGTAPTQQQMQTVQLQDPDGGMGVYEVTPQGVGRRIGSAQDPRPGRSFDQANTLRDEFVKLTSDFRVVQSAYENIRSAAASQSGAGDMSMLYAYVKLLDPTSVVRESEFATAAASGSFGERVQGAAQRVLSGERMPDTLRESFLKEAQGIYKNQKRAHDSVADQYETLAKRFGLDPATIVTRFDRPQQDQQAQAPAEPGEERPAPLPGSVRQPSTFRGPAPPPGFKVIQ